MTQSTQKELKPNLDTKSPISRRQLSKNPPTNGMVNSVEFMSHDTGSNTTAASVEVPG
jgi:hypothetical protein